MRIFMVIAAFTVLYVMLSTISYIAEGGMELKVTRLSADVGVSDTVIYVDDTTGYDVTGELTVEGEEMYYIGITDTAFLNVTRGYNGTDACTHESRLKVYDPRAATLNDAMGFDLAELNTNAGILSLAFIPLKFFTDVVPDLIMMDFSVLKEGPMQYFRTILFCFSMAFVVGIAIIIASSFGGPMQSIIGRWTR